VIKHLHMKDLTLKEIKTELDVHNTFAPAYTIEWMNLNVVIYMYVRDVQLRLRQKSSIKSTILFWLIDEWKCASLLRPHAYHMAHGYFNFARTIKYEKAIDGCCVCSLWTKRDSVTILKQYLEMFQRNPNKFLRRFITVDETWIHYFIPATKEQPK